MRASTALVVLAAGLVSAGYGGDYSSYDYESSASDAVEYSSEYASGTATVILSSVYSTPTYAPSSGSSLPYSTNTTMTTSSKTTTKTSTTDKVTLTSTDEESVTSATTSDAAEATSVDDSGAAEKAPWNLALVGVVGVAFALL